MFTVVFFTFGGEFELRGGSGYLWDIEAKGMCKMCKMFLTFFSTLAKTDVVLVFCVYNASP